MPTQSGYLPQEYREAVQNEIQEMLEEGIIESSNSEWSSPIIPVKKKDGSLCLCIDYRRLKSVLESDAYPSRVWMTLPTNLEGIITSTLDLTRGYWQVPVSEDVKHKTACATPFGLYQFNRMSFGLMGAPATFQRLMDRVMRGLEGVCGAYLDSLIISWADHVVHTITSQLEAAASNRY